MNHSIELGCQSSTHSVVERERPSVWKGERAKLLEIIDQVSPDRHHPSPPARGGDCSNDVGLVVFHGSGANCSG
jgi:hypothetical protein